MGCRCSLQKLRDNHEIPCFPWASSASVLCSDFIEMIWVLTGYVQSVLKAKVRCKVTVVVIISTVLVLLRSSSSLFIYPRTLQTDPQSNPHERSQQISAGHGSGPLCYVSDWKTLVENLRRLFFPVLCFYLIPPVLHRAQHSIHPPML